MVVIRFEQGCDPTRSSPNSPYFIDDRVNKIAHTNITDHRSHSGSRDEATSVRMLTKLFQEVLQVRISIREMICKKDRIV